MSEYSKLIYLGETAKDFPEKVMLGLSSKHVLVLLGGSRGRAL